MLSNQCFKQETREHIITLRNVFCKLGIPSLYHASVCTVYTLLQGLHYGEIPNSELLQRYYGRVFFPVELYHDYKALFDLLMCYGVPAYRYEQIIREVGKSLCEESAVTDLCVIVRGDLDAVDTYLCCTLPYNHTQCTCVKDYLECCNKMSFSKCFDAIYKFLVPLQN